MPNVLQGSEREPMAGARSAGTWDPSARIRVSVLVRRSDARALRAHVATMAASETPAAPMERAEFARRFGAAAADVAAVRSFAEAQHLTVVEEDLARRTIVLEGSVADFQTAFGVELLRFEYAGGSYRGRVGPIYLPDELAGVVEAVLGLDDRPQARPHFRVRAASAAASFTPPEVAAFYKYPAASGAGECIALIELGGGFVTADLASYFAGLKIAMPSVAAMSVDGGTNAPTGDPNGPDGEVMLDIEIAGSIAPAASIVAYFAPNTDAGFIDAVTTAVHDTTNKPSVVSISWGGPESGWTQQALTALDQAFQAAAALGVTVCVASGDDGSSDGVTDGKPHVDFPASSPFALACGGTSVRAASGAIASETVWNDGTSGGASGGGVSAVFPLPAWQAGLSVTSASGTASSLSGRGVPDVCGDADPQSGYDVRVDGTSAVYGGTSAVAPLWAALIARINSTKKAPAGYINALLYKNPSLLNDITSGNNGAFAAAPGWDACTGLGSPDGAALAGALP
jgi:kumamolisin